LSRLLLILGLIIGLGFSNHLESYPSQQDPLVEEAIRSYGKAARIYGQVMEARRVEGVEPNWQEAISYWQGTINELKLIEGKLVDNPQSRAVVYMLLIKSYYVLDKIEKWSMPAPYIREKLQKISKAADIANTYGFSLSIPLNPDYIEEMLKYYDRLVEYDPDLYFAAAWIEETDEVYYLVNWENKDIFNEWYGIVQSKLYDNTTKNPKQTRGLDILPTPAYALVGWAYLGKGDYVKAIPYLEAMKYWDEVKLFELSNIRLSKTSGEDTIEKLRRFYLQQLKAKGEEDELHPFLYVNAKPLDPKKGFTKEKTPYVSLSELAKAIGATAEWRKEGEFLTISKGEESLRIVNRNGTWKAYKNKASRVVKAYLKDGELYLSLFELPSLLNLKLEWDEETYIGKITT